MLNTKPVQGSESEALPTLMTKAEIASELRRTPGSVDQLRARDESFPKPIREGDHRRGRIYFVRAEFMQWLSRRLESRVEAA